MKINSLAWYHPISLLCTWFGTGLAPQAKGTVGTLMALPFAWVIQSYGGNGALLIASAVAFAIGVPASNIYMQRRATGHDPREIVIDEVAGVWLTLCSMDILNWRSYVVGFILFRLYDIMKPWPISLADRKVKGGLGVMFDDLVAALYAIVVIVTVRAAITYFGIDVVRV